MQRERNNCTVCEGACEHKTSRRTAAGIRGRRSRSRSPGEGGGDPESRRADAARSKPVIEQLECQPRRGQRLCLVLTLSRVWGNGWAAGPARAEQLGEARRWSWRWSCLQLGTVWWPELCSNLNENEGFEVTDQAKTLGYSSIQANLFLDSRKIRFILFTCNEQPCFRVYQVNKFFIR